MNIQRLGKIIQEERLKLGLSIEKVSRDACVTRKTIYNMEHGKPVTMGTVIRVCDVLGMEVVIEDKVN